MAEDTRERRHGSVSGQWQFGSGWCDLGQVGDNLGRFREIWVRLVKIWVGQLESRSGQ